MTLFHFVHHDDVQKPYTLLSLVALLKLLTGEIQPVKGEVKRNPRLRMGIYNQHFVDRLPMGKTPVEHLRDVIDTRTRIINPFVTG